MSKAHYVVSAIGENRTGIVADVSEVIFNSGCNIEDSRMSLLGDQFALLTLVSAKDDAVSRALYHGCDRLKEEKGIVAAVFHAHAKRSHGRPASPEANYEIRVVGMDRSGIVCRTSRVLADRDVDILDMTTHTRRAPQSGSPVFTMDAHLMVPDDADLRGLKRALKDLADALVVEISLRKTIVNGQ